MPKTKLSVVDPKKAGVELIIEDYPVDYNGLPFITLVQYNKKPMLAIVDNMTDDSIKAYVLDLCGPEHVSEELILTVANEWYQKSRDLYPISIEFSRRGLTPIMSKLYRTLNVEFVSRVIGPVAKFPMRGATSVKRRKRKSVAPQMVDTVLLAEEFFK